MAAHRYYRLLITSLPAGWGGVDPAAVVGELQIRDSGAANLPIVHGGSATSSEGSGSACFDNNTSIGGSSWTSYSAPTWVIWDFGAGNEQDAFDIGLFLNWGIGAFVFAHSDDGTVWTDRYSSVGGIATNTYHYFTLSASPNVAPVITSNGGGATATIDITEATTTAVTTVTATDGDGDTLTYSLSGADASEFTINSSTGALVFNALPDYEAPTDAQQVNAYHVTVIASDASAQDSQDLTINVLDISVVFTNNGGGTSIDLSINENTTVVTTVQATGATSYAITGGTDSSLFQVNSSTGELSFIDAPDFENPTDSNTNNIYEVIVTASLGTETGDQTLTVTVLDVAFGQAGEPHIGINWKPVVIVDGVDVSSRITGLIDIDAEESTSKVASFLLRPQSGTVNAGDWLGVPVSIDYKTESGSGVTLSQKRVFTGTVDQALYDPNTRLTSFDCSDDMQGKFEAMTQAEIDAIILNSRYSEAAFGDYKDGWLYLEDLLSTHPQSYDYNVDGVTGTLVNWAAKTTPDFSYDSSSIIGGSISYSIAPKRELFNKYTIDYSYRFSRLLHRKHDFKWSGFVFNEYFNKSHDLPTKDMITSAAMSAGWNVSTVIQFEQLPADYAGFGLSEELRDILATRAAWSATKRWSQDVTENYTITVEAPQSVAWLGEVAFEEHASNKTELNVDGWNEGSDTPTGRSNALGDTVQDKYDRTVSRNDLETLVARARTEILSSHRNNFVEAEISLNPLIERFHTLELNAHGVHGKGKVYSFKHSMNIDTGEAVTKVKIAISINGGLASAGDSIIGFPVEPNTDPVSTPTASETALETHIGKDDTVDDYDESWDGFTGNYSIFYGTPTAAQQYPRRFRVVTPDINQDSIDHIEGETTQTYSFDIPDELLTVTVS